MSAGASADHRQTSTPSSRREGERTQLGKAG